VIRLAALALALALAAAGPARADDPADEGVGAPTGPPWSEARDRLVVQLRPADARSVPNAIFRQDVPHTRTALVLAPETPGEPAQDVTLADALAWGRTGEALFEIALENLARRFPPAVRETPELPHGVRVRLLYGEHPFAAAHAIEIASHERCLGRGGALVAVPTQHAVLCHPIETSRAFHAYLALVSMAADLQLDGANPIVPHVYWFEDGVWDTQRVTLEGKRLSPEQTDAFRAHLEALPPDAHDRRPRLPPRRR